jgi:microsomal dipeptidase-like Zn-dependent dipeptidase
VFISYRREDSQEQARALFQDPVARLGRSAGFMGIDSIALGRDFREALQERLATCDLMLVLIGPDWLSGTDCAGRRCLEEQAGNETATVTESAKPSTFA